MPSPKTMLYPTHYAPELLESFAHKKTQHDSWTSFICPEFTALCPKTGQPDFATMTINYVADELMLESKSCKLYLFSFRHHSAFHEDCVQTICDDLTGLLTPKYLEVIGEFAPRGGIALFPFASMSNEQRKYRDLREERFSQYAPGRYSDSDSSGKRRI